MTTIHINIDWNLPVDDNELADFKEALEVAVRDLLLDGMDSAIPLPLHNFVENLEVY